MSQPRPAGEGEGEGPASGEPAQRPPPAPPTPPPTTPPHAAKKLVILMITAFVDMLGVLMVIPLLPFYATDLNASGFVVTLLIASFAVAQLISAPLWGRFSDTYGRRPALLVGLFASAMAYVIFAYADTLWLLFLSRLVQGAGGGTVGVIQAYVADATRPEDRARSLGWLSAATNLGVAIGPVVGAAALPFGRPAPGLLAAGLCLLNIVFAWRFLTESHDFAAGRASTIRKRPSREVVARVVAHPGEPTSRLIWIYSLTMGTFQGCMAVLALFLAAKFAVTAQTIGFFFTYIGGLSVLTRAVILGPLVDRLGEARLARLGIVLLGVGLGLLPFAPNYPLLALAIAALPLGTAFTFPCVTALLSRVIGNHERGVYMGVQQTFGGTTRATFPLLAGLAFDHLGHSVPFWGAALLMAGILPLTAGLEEYTRVHPAAAADV